METRNRPGSSDEASIKVFVQISRHQNARAWREAYLSQELVGRNDETPYGYGRAADMGCSVEFSQAVPLSLPQKLQRYAARAMLGFDLVHAQTQDFADAQIVWTHTESHFLAVAAALGDNERRPRLLGQAVWLFDHWSRLSPFHKRYYRKLMERVDVLMTHSSLNAARARELMPDLRVEFVPFGIPSENAIAPIDRSDLGQRVIAVGNDRHRDWPTFLEAADRLPDLQFSIFSGTAGKFGANARSNVVAKLAGTNEELNQGYARARVAVAPLKPNLHASGITAIQEALLAGLPVVATQTGGLEDYFPDDEVCYVPHGEPEALAEAIEYLATDGDAGREMVQRAQKRMKSGLDAEGYVRRQVELSRELLGGNA